jgi:hypothetical protein
MGQAFDETAWTHDKIDHLLDTARHRSYFESVQNKIREWFRACEVFGAGLFCQANGISPERCPVVAVGLGQSGRLL